MGRKRNQGKARKEAKAARRGEQELQKLYNFYAMLRTGLPCSHGADAGSFSSISTDICFHLATRFEGAFSSASKDSDRSLWEMIEGARDATMDEFSEVWKDSAKMKTVMSHLLCDGVQFILDGKDGDARVFATLIRYLEQYIAVELHETQALFNCPKIGETYLADDHTLVKFFWKRIPCSCLDEKYQEVKHITKKGCCYNPQCSIPGKTVERRQTKYCSRCRCATYCSRECQKADWTIHKIDCDIDAARIVKFEAGQQSV